MKCLTTQIQIIYSINSLVYKNDLNSLYGETCLNVQLFITDTCL